MQFGNRRSGLAKFSEFLIFIITNTERYLLQNESEDDQGLTISISLRRFPSERLTSVLPSLHSRNITFFIMSQNFVGNFRIPSVNSTQIIPNFFELERKLLCLDVRFLYNYTLQTLLWISCSVACNFCVNMTLFSAILMFTHLLQKLLISSYMF